MDSHYPRWLYTSSREPNMGPRACRTHALPTRLSSQPFKLYKFKATNYLLFSNFQPNRLHCIYRHCSPSQTMIILGNTQKTAAIQPALAHKRNGNVCVLSRVVRTAIVGCSSAQCDPITQKVRKENQKLQAKLSYRGPPVST